VKFPVLELLTLEGDHTRYLVISKHYLRTPTGNDVTLVLFEVNHHPGSLSSALATFGRHNVSLLSIESRPVLPEEHRQGQDRIFRFLVELIGHAEDYNVKSALSALEEHASNISIIGSFQRGKVISNEWDP
jgi:chorismate mutase/prephenate dehydratase